MTQNTNEPLPLPNHGYRPYLMTGEQHMIARQLGFMLEDRNGKVAPADDFHGGVEGWLDARMVVRSPIHALTLHSIKVMYPDPYYLQRECIGAIRKHGDEAAIQTRETIVSAHALLAEVWASLVLSALGRR